LEWTQVIIAPDLEIELISDEEAARRRGLIKKPDSPQPLKPAKR
jgi:hypothetical protein